MTVRAKTIRIPGPVAQDKDLARKIRQKQLLPGLEAGGSVVLDFSRVVTATQSFLHACISEAVRLHGEEVLDVLEFRRCADEIQQLIGTVVEYSLRARTLTQEGLSGKLRKVDVPQADNLEVVRRVVDAIAAGYTSVEDLADATGFSSRHVQYRLHAARVLGLVRMGTNLSSLTERGRRFVATRPASRAEQDSLCAAVRESAILQKLCPNLLDSRGPTVAELGRRLAQKTGLSKATAVRRARSLLAWRRQLLQAPMPLDGVG